MAAPATLMDCLDISPAATDLRSEVQEMLGRDPPTLPCKLFYDEVGSALFDEICALPEYYPTRVESAILRRYARSMGEHLGPGTLLIEFGSGSSVKTRILLDRLGELAGYVPIDISSEHLRKSASLLAREYPHLEVWPVVADYTRPLQLPKSLLSRGRPAVFFPGSTVGNFHPARVEEFLQRVRRLVGEGGGLLTGVDLKKDPAVLTAAYDDAAGVTAQFNLNALAHLNRVLHCDFDLAAWRHQVHYDVEKGRIELHLVTQKDQVVHVGASAFRFHQGASIRTECSYKYTVEEFQALARRGGFESVQVWTDPQALFSVQFFRSVP